MLTDSGFMSDVPHVRIAYLIIAYEDPQQLARLIKRLAEDADVYIHINKRVKIDPFKYATEKIHVNGNVRFIEHRHKVNWGGYSILRATFSLLDEAFSNKMYDRVILLTGLDYPIKTTEQIQSFFVKNKDVDFISTKMTDGREYATLNRMYHRDWWVSKLFFEGLARYLPECRIIKKKDHIEYNDMIYSIYGISPKWALRGKSAKYVLDFNRNNPAFNRYFKSMHAPDDFYFATVLNHSVFKKDLSDPQNLFYIKWLPDNGGAKVLDIADIEEVRSADALYAKKFRTSISDELMDCLSQLKGNGR